MVAKNPDLEWDLDDNCALNQAWDSDDDLPLVQARGVLWGVTR